MLNMDVFGPTVRVFCVLDLSHVREEYRLRLLENRICRAMAQAVSPTWTDPGSIPSQSMWDLW